MAAAAIDVKYLSAYLCVPQDNLSNIIDTPTADLVRAVLIAISKKALEHDELVADKLRVDIEFENEVRKSEIQIESLKTNLENAQKNVESINTKLCEEVKSKASIEAELQALKSSSTNSLSEIESLRARISSLEAANRDTIAIVESKSTANDELSKDLQKQHQKGLELSQQLSALQQDVQIAKSAASSASFREGNVKQELELAKRNNEWLENELKTKSAEAMKCRKEKGARVAELQRENEELTSNIESLRKTEQALRNRLEEVQKTAEDSLAKVQQLQEDAAKAEDSFRQELESSRRLAELQSQQSNMHRNRLLEVEAGVEKIKDNAVEEVGRYRAEAESERREREQAENRIAELELEVDRLEAQAAQARHNSQPGTPRRALNGTLISHMGTPGQPATPGSTRSRLNITATQAIEELGKVKIEYRKEKLRTASLEAQIDQMVEGLEAKKPYIDDLEQENRRLEKEMFEMSRFVEQIGKEKDIATKNARLAKGEASTAQAEANILTQQLRDLSSQVKMLLADQAARDQGWGELSASDKSRLESLAAGEVSDGALDELSATDQLISQRLVVFRNISELQQKNQDQLKIIRQLGAQMESEEAIAAKKQAAQDHEEVQKLLAKVEDYKDELHNLITRSESYIKERDMFRRMLQHRGQIPANLDINSMFGQSVNGSQSHLPDTIEAGGNECVQLTAAIRNLQSQYDRYREEQTVDRNTLKEQVARLSQEKSSLHSEIAKVNSQLTLFSDRYDLLNSNYAMLGNENKELQKKAQILSETAVKQDLRTQQVAEDLVEAKGQLESMRYENANLKAEKMLWKDIQERLAKDNDNLMSERTRLNNLVANQQHLQNEREMSESETRRRLLSQVDSLEAELSSTKRKLNEEVEESKKAQLRKEYDLLQNQKRIDGLVASLSQIREEFAVIKTSRDHFQSRADELIIQLKSSEERVQLLQLKSTRRESDSQDIDGDLTREQELTMEISELKRDLDLARSEVDNAKLQMEQYKAIAQATEEEMEALNSTSDQFREEMDLIIDEKDKKIRDIEQQAEDLSKKLTDTNNELSELQASNAEIASRTEEEMASLQAEVARLKEEDERHATAAQFHQQDLRAQAQIATKAQQDYENELVKHAEAAKLLQCVRAELNQLKVNSASLKADAESARTALSQCEISWEERREKLEEEMEELRRRRDDLMAQNKILHEQLENISSQVSSLQQSRSHKANYEDSSAELDSHSQRNVDGLRELNTFLRREKEIVEVQYDLKVQESKRLQQQLEYTQAQLDEHRLKLDQERRSQADMNKSSLAHKDLMEKLNELNLFRESSTTLRNELRQAQSQLTEKSERVNGLLEQIQPLETKIHELEHSKESLEGEMRLLQEDRDRWQKRTQDILSKSDRIDPAEVEQLKETVESLRSERDTLLEEQKPLFEKIGNFEAERSSWAQSRQKLIEQAKERNRINTKDIKDRTNERDAAIQEKQTLQQNLTDLQAQLATAIEEKDSTGQLLMKITQELESCKSEKDNALSASLQDPKDLINSTSEQNSNLAIDEQVVELRRELELVTHEKQMLQIEIKDLKEKLENTKSELNDAQEVIRTRTISSSTLITERESEEDQVEDVNSSNPISEAERKAFENQIIEAQSKVVEHEKRVKQIEEEMESKLKKRSDTMKTALNKKLAESKQTQKAELEAEYRLRFEREKQIWIAECRANQAEQMPQISLQSEDKQAASIETLPVGSTDAIIPSALSQAKEIPSLSNISDDEARQLCQNNKTIREIIKGNIMTKLSAEIQKLKEEHTKTLTDALQKAETIKTQAVSMETKKSALKINMSENRIRIATGKLQVVEVAAQTTPERAVGEVWVEVKNYKPPPLAAPSSLPATPNFAPKFSTNGATASPSEPTPATATPVGQISSLLAPNSPSVPSRATTGPSNSISTNTLPHQLPQRVSSIPMMRGAANIRGRGGHQNYQPPRGGSRGRGGTPNSAGLNRGNLASNVGAPFNPIGSVGTKRIRDEVAIAGPHENGGKRPRGG